MTSCCFYNLSYCLILMISFSLLYLVKMRSLLTTYIRNVIYSFSKRRKNWINWGHLLCNKNSSIDWSTDSNYDIWCEDFNPFLFLDSRIFFQLCVLCKMKYIMLKGWQDYYSFVNFKAITEKWIKSVGLYIPEQNFCSLTL